MVLMLLELQEMQVEVVVEAVDVEVLYFLCIELEHLLQQHLLVEHDEHFELDFEHEQVE